MSGSLTYQQDTVEVKNPLKNLLDFRDQRELRIDRNIPVPIEPVPRRDTIAEIDSTEQTQTVRPTIAQIRYWRWQRELKLIVGDSRYIRPKYEVTLVKPSECETGDFGLPSRNINSINTDWLTVIFILALIIFASIRNSYTKYLGNLFKSLFNYTTAFRMFREKNYPLLHAAYRLDIYFYIIFSVFLFQVFTFFRFDFTRNNLNLFLICFGITLAYFMVKKVAYKFSGLITENVDDTNEYIFTMESINRVAGMILFPLVVTGVFFPYINPGVTIFIGLFVLLIFYLKLLQRGVLILFRKQFSIFYLFLYFCTLEFVPLVLLYNILGI